jgi:hypothetical protein
LVRDERDGASWHNPVASALRNGWEILNHRPTQRYDRIGALVFFIVIGLPVFILGLVLIVQPTIP